jgi:YD repeat-containing protein
MATHAQLLQQLKNQSYTGGWGAVVAFDGASAARRLSDYYALMFHGPAAMVPIRVERIDIVENGGGYATLDGVVLQAPRVSFIESSLQHSRMLVSYELAKGIYTERSTRANHADRVNRLINAGVGRSYTFSFEVDLSLMEGTVGSYGQVQLGLSGGSNPLCDLGSNPFIQAQVGARLLEQLTLRYATGVQALPLGWIETQRGHTLPKKFVLRTQAKPGSNGAEGALVLFISDPGGREDGIPLDADFPYLIPDDAGYGATVLVSPAYPLLLEGEAESLFGQLLFPNERYFSTISRHTDTVDEVVFGRFQGPIIAQPNTRPRIDAAGLAAQVVTRDVGIAAEPVTIIASIDSSEDWEWSLETPDLGLLSTDGASAVYTPPQTLALAASVAVQRVRAEHRASGKHMEVCVVLQNGASQINILNGTVKTPVMENVRPGMTLFLETDNPYAGYPGTEPHWSVLGKGNVTNGRYEAPAAPDNDIDVIVYEFTAGIMTLFGYCIVQFDKSLPVEHWTSLVMKLKSPNTHAQPLANGMQQLAIEVTLDTGVNGKPVLPQELATLRLITKEGAEVPFLPATVEGLQRPVGRSDDSRANWAFKAERNQYVLAWRAVTPTRDAGANQVQTVTLYLHTLAESPEEFAVRLTDIDNKQHDSNSEGNQQDERILKVTPATVPTYSQAHYIVENKRVVGGYQSRPEDPYWTPEKPNNAWNFETVDYWHYKIIYDNLQLKFYRLQWEQDGPGVRWESEAANEDAFSYLGYLLVPAKGDVPRPTHLRYGAALYDPLLYKDYPEHDGVPNSSVIPAEIGDSGTLLIALHRVLNIFYRTKALIPGFDLERTTDVSLWDEGGTRHRLAFGFEADNRNIVVYSTLPNERDTDGASAPCPRPEEQGAKASSTAVHSNAFNFMSFIENGVDPRTGQYTLAINLPALQSYDLNGPEFPLSLTYNPLNTTNSGYGMGWDLRLSQYTPATGILALSTGETFKSTAIQDGQLVFKEQKLDSFRCYVDGGGWYRVVHKSGLVEFLQVQGVAGYEVALPRYIESAQGHRLQLEYQPFSNTLRLASVSDGSNRLLAISREGNLVHIDLRPGSGAAGAAWARYTLHLGGNERVERISLPSEPASSWRFTYEQAKGMLCLKTVSSPTGAVETLEYLGDGHVFPGDGRAVQRRAKGAPLSARATAALASRGQPDTEHDNEAFELGAGKARAPLPRVSRHVTDPGFGQPLIDVRYAYTLDGAPSIHNFLGGGLTDVVFEDDGLDNIYKTRTAYRYGSVETLWVEGAPVRSITRTFNRYHLLIEERTQQNASVKQVVTEYHINEELPFDLQEPQVQLPRQVATTWTDEASSTSRTEREYSSFDRFGNPTLSQSANGVREVSSWYPAEGAEGCPADPYGFVRHLREQTTYPAESAYTDAPVLSTRLRYARQEPLAALPYEPGQAPPVSGSRLPWLAPISELQTNLADGVASEVQVTVTDYLHEPANPTLHGRAKTVKVTLGGETSFPSSGAPVTVGGYPSTTAYAYEKIAATSRLRTVETLTTFDGLEKVILREASALTGNVLLDRDDNDIEIETLYNALDQVIAETAAPNTAESATRHYQYRLVNASGEQAEQCVTDVKGVQTRTLFDGLNRAIKEERQTADSPSRAQEFVQTYAATYDALGQLVSETEYDSRLGDAPTLPQLSFAEDEWDWLGEDSLALTTRYTYDDWGQQTSATGPDGVVEYEQTNPTTLVTTTRRTGMAETRVTNNLFEKPESIERRTLADGLYSKETSVYDGLGRLRKEVDAMRRETSYSYDVFDRLTTNVLPDRNVVKREYAGHSGEDLPTSISVIDNSQSPIKHLLLGTQEFDGLSRLTFAVTGNRPRRNIYLGSQAQPAFVHTPAGHIISYTYKPHLSDEPLTRQIVDATGIKALKATKALKGIKGINASPAAISASYELDPHNARLLSGVESGHEFIREFFSTGEVKSERRVDAGGEHAMSYVYSLRGRLLSYTDVQGNTQTHSYDLGGRLSATRLETTHTKLSYNVSGLTASIDTQDEALGQRVNISLEYDEQGRECLRTFDLGAGQQQTLAQEYTVLDQMSKRTLKEAGAALRAEEFFYDARGRLDFYMAEGSEAPFDPAGNQIVSQLFICDAIDNHRSVETEFKRADGSVAYNWADYSYSELDPAQLVQITNDDPDYAARFDMTLRYDGNGCLLVDEEGRALQYDALSRLVAVKPADGDELSYGYDAQDILSSAANERRFYRAGELVSLVEPGGEVRTIVRAGEALVAEHQTLITPEE